MQSHSYKRKALSPRQREVALLMAEGHSNPEIAHKMGTSLHTVRNQTHIILAKLGVSRRSEVIIMKFKGKL